MCQTRGWIAVCVGLLFEQQEIGIVRVGEANVHQSLGQFLEDLLGIVNAATP